MQITAITGDAKYPTATPGTLGSSVAPSISASYIELAIKLSGISGEINAFLLGWDTDCGWAPLATLVCNERDSPPLAGHNRFDQLFLPSARSVCLYVPDVSSSQISACIEGYAQPAAPDLASPPIIGSGTPNVVNATTVPIQGGASPTARSPFMTVYATPSGNGFGLAAANGGNYIETQEQFPSPSGTGLIVKRRIIVTLGDSGGFVDVPISGSGHGILTGTGTANAYGGMFFYASDATVSTNGLSYTLFDVANTAGKLCVIKHAGPALRIQNNNFGILVGILELTELQHA